MFRNLLNRLFDTEKNDSRAPLAAEDAEVAIAALLVRVARSDGRYDMGERQRIDMVLARRLGLNSAEAAERRAAAEMIEAEAPDTVRFTRLVKERIALEDRSAVIAGMWEVAYSDSDRAADEDTMIRLVAGLLGVPDRDSGLIRQQVMDRMGIRKD